MGITAVAWDRDRARGGSGEGSGTILVGSDRGEIFETRLGVDKHTYFCKVYDLALKRKGKGKGGKGNKSISGAAVSGLAFETFPSASAAEDKKFFVMIATARPTRHYQFVGGPTFSDLFAAYAGGPTEGAAADAIARALRGEGNGDFSTVIESKAAEAAGSRFEARFVELPSDSAVCELRFSSQHGHGHGTRGDGTAGVQVAAGRGSGIGGGKGKGTRGQRSLLAGRPDSFALLTGVGVYHGRLLFSSQGPGDSVITDCALIPFPEHDDAQERAKAVLSPVATATGQPSGTGPEAPISMAVTEFHFLLLYPDRLAALSRISGELVLSVPLAPLTARFGALRSLARDASTGALFICAGKTIVSAMLSNEGRDAWRLFLRRAQTGARLEQREQPQAGEGTRLHTVEKGEAGDGNQSAVKSRRSRGVKGDGIDGVDSVYDDFDDDDDEEDHDDLENGADDDESVGAALNDFHEALRCCSTSKQRDVVQTAEAEFCLAHGA